MRLLRCLLVGYWVRRIKPLIHHRGLLMLTSSAVYFQPHPNFTNSSTKAYSIRSLLHCFRRIQCLRPNALELVLYSGNTARSSGQFGHFGSLPDSRPVSWNSHDLGRQASGGGGFGDENCDGGWRAKGKSKRPYKLVLLEFESVEEREIVARALQKEKPE